MKKGLALLLALLLGATPVLAVNTGAAEKFPATATYSGYADVPGSAWFAAGAQLCYETRLMQGSGGKFSPAQNMSICEAVAVAARIHEILAGGDGVIPNAANAPAWYTGVMDYFRGLCAGDAALQARLSTPEQPATRGDFLHILAAALPNEQLAPINKITVLPDTTDAAVLRFYNAGILTGVTDCGTFAAALPLTRAEAAVMIARVVRPAQRKRFTPAAIVRTENPTRTITGLAPEEPMYYVGKTPIPAEDYLFFVGSAMRRAELACAEQGMEFSWDITVDGQSMLNYVMSNAHAGALTQAALRERARAEGVKIPATESAAIDAAMVQNSRLMGSDAALRDYLLGNCGTAADYRRLELEPRALTTALADNLARPKNPAMDAYLAAKHILISDKKTAENVLAQLKAKPADFDTLMAQHTEDSAGLAANPNGYLFSAGEMVPEFEAATRALAVGKMSGLVKSQFGYHIILRVSPRSPAFCSQALRRQLQATLERAVVTRAPAAEHFDPLAFYNSLLCFRTALGK